MGHVRSHFFLDAVSPLAATLAAMAAAQAKAFDALVASLRKDTSGALPLVEQLAELARREELAFPNGISLLTVKVDALLAYVQQLMLLCAHKLRQRSLQDDIGARAVQTLVKLRLVLEKVRPMEARLRYQIEKLVRAASAEAAAATGAPAAGPGAEAEEDEDAEIGTSRRVRAAGTNAQTPWLSDRTRQRWPRRRRVALPRSASRTLVGGTCRRSWHLSCTTPTRDRRAVHGTRSGCRRGTQRCWRTCPRGCPPRRTRRAWRASVVAARAARRARRVRVRCGACRTLRRRTTCVCR